MELIITFGRGITARAIKTQFLVVDCPSLYQCIFRRPTLAELIMVPSTVHLKMKYYTTEGLVATLHGDIQAAKRFFEASAKGLISINGQPRTTTRAMLPCSSEESRPLPRVDTIDLDSRFSVEDRVEQRKKWNEPMVEDEGSTSSASHNELSSHTLPIPDSDFELVPLGEDPTRGVKIGADLPDLAKRKLKLAYRKMLISLPGVSRDVRFRP